MSKVRSLGATELVSASLETIVPPPQEALMDWLMNEWSHCTNLNNHAVEFSIIKLLGSGIKNSAAQRFSLESCRFLIFSLD